MILHSHLDDWDKKGILERLYKIEDAYVEILKISEIETVRLELERVRRQIRELKR